MLKFFAIAALISTPAMSQRVVCQRVFNTVQCNEYDVPQYQMQMPTYQQNPLVGQMLSNQAINGFQQARQRALQAQIEAQNQQIENCRYAMAHGFAC